VAAPFMKQPPLRYFLSGSMTTVYRLNALKTLRLTEQQKTIILVLRLRVADGVQISSAQDDAG